MAKSLFEKLWQAHHITKMDDGRHLLYIDRIFLHERTGSIALKSLLADGRKVLRPEQAFCAMDHIVDTTPDRSDNTLMPSGGDFIRATREAASEAGIKLYDLHDEGQGISHVVAAEEGIALPGLTHVCPDSHTCTLGGLGAFAWGIGSTEAEHALATKTLAMQKPRSMQVRLNGQLPNGVSAKDMILTLIAKYGADGGSGYAVEFAGEAIEQLSVEGRMTLCNMAVEFSAFSGFCATDEKTIAYVKDRLYSPKGEAFEQAANYWRSLHSDPGAGFDAVLELDCTALRPQVSWGTNPQHSIAIDACIPQPEREQDANRRGQMEKALSYIGLDTGQAISGVALDAAFIGSCTNSRLSDLRLAAGFLKGKRVHPTISAVCVPGSRHVKRAAEAEGLDKIFIEAGFQWREPGCSMCFYAGGETFGEGKRVISSTNRNFEGRQGPKVKTHIASPLTVAASAVAGHICSAGEFAEEQAA